MGVLEPIKLGRVRSVSRSLFLFLLTISSLSSRYLPYQVKLLCPKLGSSKFARAGSSGVSLLSALAIILVAACLASIGLVWRRLRRKKAFEEGREETEELHSC